MSYVIYVHVDLRVVSKTTCVYTCKLKPLLQRERRSDRIPRKFLRRKSGSFKNIRK